ncbi:SRPBCC family protein [Pendulispora brunnea]|uniref:SRPBCC family protein n=1 Tax=Pendulispora brunnea TaxID=2905690 RepID=A0ABZ2KEK1_9BACT
MFRKIAAGVAAVIVLFLIVVATRPSKFHVERSIDIAAPPQFAFDQVNDFHAWVDWSPYEKLDPKMQRTFEGPRAGTGAVYAWSSEAGAGAGRMTLQKSEKPSLITIELAFLKPMQATDVATFTFTPTATGTKATWALDGDMNFVSKAFGLFMDMDKMIGGDFERGLVSLKALSESTSKSHVEASN